MNDQKPECRCEECGIKLVNKGEMTVGLCELCAVEKLKP